jgi:hypothetical protein
MSQKKQDAAIQKWFSYIKDEKKRKGEIGRARENIGLGIITYPEWVKSTLLMNRIDQVNDREASIELLNTLNGKIHPRIGSDSKNGISFVESLLTYYVGKHSKEDVSRFVSECKSEKPSKKKVEEKEKSRFKFFGNW